MEIIEYRKRAVRTITPEKGVYVLCDLDGVPLYVGQSTDGIRKRVSRHLTSARSDIIANRQIDVWEIAYVWAYPEADRDEIKRLESALYHKFDPVSQLMNGSVPAPVNCPAPYAPEQVVQVMPNEEIAARRDASLRLPRQADHYAQIVGHFLSVKNSNQIARAMNAHFSRLAKYHRQLLGLAEDTDEDAER